MLRIKFIFTLTIFLFTISCVAQNTQKEVFLMGTMHGVPKIIKHSYKPLFKRAMKYQPDAIYIERIRPEDTLSQKKAYQHYITYADSIKGTFEYEASRFETIRNKDLEHMSQDDFRYLAKSFLIKMDISNFKYYAYLLKHGLKGSKKPSREEDGDLSFKTAARLGLKYIHSMDDQSERDLYHQKWKECVEEGRKNGNNEIVNKLSKKDHRRSIIPAIFRRLGILNNKLNVMELFHRINSFRYVKTPCKPCEEGGVIWDNRNRKMAMNIGEQVMANQHQRNLVVVGAGHVVGMKAELEKLYPNIVVKIMEDQPHKTAKPIQQTEWVSQK